MLHIRLQVAKMEELECLSWPEVGPDTDSLVLARAEIAR
jgi:hypothetical protein